MSRGEWIAEAVRWLGGVALVALGARLCVELGALRWLALAWTAFNGGTTP